MLTNVFANLFLLIINTKKDLQVKLTSLLIIPKSKIRNSKLTILLSRIAQILLPS